MRVNKQLFNLLYTDYETSGLAELEYDIIRIIDLTDLYMEFKNDINDEGEINLTKKEISTIFLFLVEYLICSVRHLDKGLYSWDEYIDTACEVIEQVLHDELILSCKNKKLNIEYRSELDDIFYDISAIMSKCYYTVFTYLIECKIIKQDTEQTYPFRWEFVQDFNGGLFNVKLHLLDKL